MATGGWARTVVLVEDHALLRSLVAEALATAGFVVHQYTAAGTVLAELDRIDPDLVISDVDLGSRPNGTELAVILGAAHPVLPVMLLTNYPSAAVIPGGAALPKNVVVVDKNALDSVEELVGLVEAVLTGTRSTAGRSTAGRPAGTRPIRATADSDGAHANDGTRDSGAASDPIRCLTRHQLETLRLIALGLSNGEIAARSDIGLRSVERSIGRLFDSLGLLPDAAVNPRVAATRLYIAAFGIPVNA